MKITFIADPTLFEVQEMLDCVALSHDLDELLPQMVGLTYAQFLQAGWCYLWYDAESLAPLGYTLFSFHAGLVKHRKPVPEFFFASTHFCELRHILKVRKAMLSLMRAEFKNRVFSYIDSRRIAKFARANGFNPHTTRKNIWEKAEASTRRQ